MCGCLSGARKIFDLLGMVSSAGHCRQGLSVRLSHAAAGMGRYRIRFQNQLQTALNWRLLPLVFLIPDLSRFISHQGLGLPPPSERRFAAGFITHHHRPRYSLFRVNMAQRPRRHLVAGAMATSIAWLAASIFSNHDPLEAAPFERLNPTPIAPTISNPGYALAHFDVLARSALSGPCVCAIGTRPSHAA